MFKYRCVGAYPIQVPDAFLEEVYPGEIIETPHEINSPHFELLEVDGQKPPGAAPKPRAPRKPKPTKPSSAAPKPDVPPSGPPADLVAPPAPAAAEAQPEGVPA